jgi:hypothetical protein
MKSLKSEGTNTISSQVHVLSRKPRAIITVLLPRHTAISENPANIGWAGEQQIISIVNEDNEKTEYLSWYIARVEG